MGNGSDPGGDHDEAQGHYARGDSSFLPRHHPLALGTHTSDWTARILGIAVHAETVRIHPFVDGNGRSTRLLAKLVFFAAQPDDAPIEEHDWAIDKGEYIRLLREHQVTRDPVPLVAFISVRPFG